LLIYTIWLRFVMQFSASALQWLPQNDRPTYLPQHSRMRLDRFCGHFELRSRSAAALLMTPLRPAVRAQRNGARMTDRAENLL
jgi:hypothetical protein